jgi:hypothetical protein
MFNPAMQFRLRTLLILLAIGPPVLAGLWFITHSIIGILIWAALLGCNALWYFMLLKSQARDDPRTRGYGSGS